MKKELGGKAIDPPSTESVTDWTKKQSQINPTKTYTATELSAMNRRFSYGFAWGLRLPPASQDQRPSDCLAIEMNEVRIVNVEWDREGVLMLGRSDLRSIIEPTDDSQHIPSAPHSPTIGNRDRPPLP